MVLSLLLHKILLRKTLVKEAINTLKSNNVHIIGTVLTQVNLKAGEYGYGYDYSYKYEADDE
jgi:Mrp family chromosome partitioning ATPase